MLNSIKRTLLAGIGAAVVTKEKVDASLKEFVREGKVSTRDARQIAERLAADGRREFASVKAEVGQRLEDLFERTEPGVRKRIDELEARLRRLERHRTRPAARRRS